MDLLFSYFDLRENRLDKTNVEISLSQLVEIENKYNSAFRHPLVEELRKMYRYVIIYIKRGEFIAQGLMFDVGLTLTALMSNTLFEKIYRIYSV